jgi:phosphatidylglycerophosphatase A
MRILVRLLATFFGCGHFPIAPATFASFVFAAILFALPMPSRAMWAGLTLVVTLVGIWVAGRAEEEFGHDGHPIVIDEIAGMLITLFWLPKTLWIWVAGFALFRLFDIWKPFPAGHAQSLPGGVGVMMDDLLAGLYAHLCLRLALHFLG